MDARNTQASDAYAHDNLVKTGLAHWLRHYRLCHVETRNVLSKC